MAELCSFERRPITIFILSKSGCKRLQKGTTIYGRETLIINNLGIIEMDDIPERQFTLLLDKGERKGSKN